MVTALTHHFRSAMYRGEVRHFRLGTPGHSFRYSMTMPLLFLDEVEEICDAYRGWATGKRAPVEFRRSDFLGGPTQSRVGDDLATAVRRSVQDANGNLPDGPIAVLANLRGWGWQFNPIALYFCFDATGREVRHLVAEVTNTPWNERHSYVIGAPGEHVMTKALHVSPFMTMDHQYRFRYSAPESELHVRMANVHRRSEVFVAMLDLERAELNAHEAALYLRRASAARVSLGIYVQALRLRLKHVPFVTHPNKIDFKPEEHRDATI